MYVIDCIEDGKQVSYIPCNGQSLEDIIEMAKQKQGKLRRWADGRACINAACDVHLADYSTKTTP